MKTLKRMIGGFLALILALGLAVVSVPATAQAAAETGIKTCPSKIRITPGYADDWAMDLELKSAMYYVKSLKSSSKNFKAEVVYENVNFRETDGTVENDENSCTIGMYAKKEGKYTLTITIGKEDDANFVYNKKVTVFAKSDSPFKKVTVNGKTDDWDRVYSAKKKIKFAVTAASGYKIQKIEVGTYKSTKDENGNVRSDIVYKAQKSKKMVSFTLSTKPYQYSYSNSHKSNDSSSKYQYQNGNWREDMAAPTIVRITYKDKWTKQPDTRSYWFYYIK